MLANLGLRSKLLVGFLLVALLTIALGVVVNRQFGLVAHATSQGLQENLANLTAREATGQLAARRASLVQQLLRAHTSAAATAIISGDEWRALLDHPDLNPTLRTALADYAYRHRSFLIAQETLASHLDATRELEQEMHARLVPAEHKLAADQVGKNAAAQKDIETIRDDTTTRLFMNFDATMSVIGLALDIQAGLGRLQAAEAGGATDGKLRAELASALSAQTDPAAVHLARLLRQQTAPGASPVTSHAALFKALTDFTASIIFNGRTTVVSQSVESITTMGDHIYAAQKASRKFEDQRNRLSSTLQSLSTRATENLQLVGRIYGDPTPAKLAPLSETEAARLAQNQADQASLAKVTSELGLTWIDTTIDQIHFNLYSPQDGLTTQAARLVQARTALTQAQTALDQALAAEAAAQTAAAQNFLQNERAHTDAIVAITTTAQRWTTAITLVVVLLAIAIALVFTEIIARPLRRVIDSLGGGADQIASASGEISSASHNLAEGAGKQAASLKQTSAVIEELSGMTQRNSALTRQAQTASGHMRATAAAGAENIRSLVTAMNDIETAGASIAQILRTINEIAFQTKILALNAAVEAARAGEAGAGFAVVADEVRALAQRCTQAADETALMINATAATSRQGSLLTGEAAKNFGTIQAHIRELESLVTEISVSSDRQDHDLRGIKTSVIHIDAVTQAAAASSEQTASAAGELNSQSQTLRESVEDLGRLVSGTRPA